MRLPPDIEPQPAPLPRDLKLAIEIFRQSVTRPLTMTELARRCGVPVRTLNQHFGAFLRVSPMRYLRRLRLAAAREALLAAGRQLTVSDVAKRYQFHHFGRFAEQYRRTFGETPAATLRRARAARPPAPSTGGRPIQLPSRERPSLAVVPCQTPATEPSLQSLAESLAQSTAAGLAADRALAVLTPWSLRASVHDPRRTARELGARYFVAGRISTDGARVRVVLHLAETATGEHVWGDSFDGDRARLFELQDRIAARVVTALPPRVRGAEIERARTEPVQSLDAHGLAMRALPFLYASRPDATCRALEFLGRAMEIDPDYGLAAALAAWGHSQLVLYNGTPAPADEKSRAIRLVQRASLLDDEDPLALTARCAVHTMTREFELAEALAARALARDPSCAWTWGRSGWLQSYRGNSATAIAHFRRALSLESSVANRANSFVGIGSAHFNAGRYDLAAHWLRRALCKEPGASWANRSLSVSYARIGEPLRAREALDALRRFSPDVTVGKVVAAVPFQPDFLDRLGDGLSSLGLPP